MKLNYGEVWGSESHARRRKMILKRHPEVAKLLEPTRPYSIILAFFTIAFGMTVTYYAKVDSLKYRMPHGLCSWQQSTFLGVPMDIRFMCWFMISLILGDIATWQLIKLWQYYVIFRWGSHLLYHSVSITQTITII